MKRTGNRDSGKERIPVFPMSGLLSGMRHAPDNIALLHAIAFLSSLYFYHQVITLYFQARGLNFVQINSLWGFIFGVKALAEVPTGLIADWMGRKRSIVLALIFQLAGEILFIFARSYVLFALCAALGGLGFAFLSGCFEAMMFDSLKARGKESEFQKVAGTNGAYAQTAVILGAFVGGFLTVELNLAGFIRVIILTAGFVAMALAVSLFLNEPSEPFSGTGRSGFSLLTDGFLLLRRNRSLQRLVLLSLLATPFLNYLLNLYPAFFVRAGVPGVWFGIGLSAASALGILTSRFAYLLEENLGVRKGVLLAALLPGLLYLCMARTRIHTLSVLLFILTYGSIQFQKPIFDDYVNRHIRTHNRATVLSLLSLITGVYIALMGLLIGALADRSLTRAFLFMGLIIVSGAVFIRIEDRHVTVSSGNE